MTAKKNYILRAAAVLLALVLITSSLVGGTFARYVKSGSGSDTARVAKFGVGITATGTMFATEYATDDGAVSGTIANSVVSSDTDKLVAPGTKGEMAKITLSGTPEVAVNVSYTPTVVKLEKWKDAGDNFYCPLVFSIKQGGTTTNIFGIDYTTADGLETAIKNAISAYSRSYAAGTNLGTAHTDGLEISWSWQIETGDNDGEKAANNVKDTYLGDQAANGNAAKVEIEVACTVTQID